MATLGDKDIQWGEGRLKGLASLLKKTKALFPLSKPENYKFWLRKVIQISLPNDAAPELNRGDIPWRVSTTG